MPIDIKEFERVITEHFKTATEEEVIQNLRKAAPYLFEETTEEPHENDAPILSEDTLTQRLAAPYLFKEVTEMPHENGASILPEDKSTQQLPEIQFSKEWLEENATAELVKNAYNCLPQSEKEKFLATILGNSPPIVLHK